MLQESDEFRTLFDKQINLLFPQYQLQQKNSKFINQVEFTEKCELLSNQMASIFLFQQNILDSYNDFLDILNEMITIKDSDFNFPFNTFNSNSIPRILTILIKTFPDSDVYFKSFEMSEKLSQNVSSAKQFCSNDFIPLVLHCLSSILQVFNDSNTSIILTLITILANIFHITDDGMVKYCVSVNELLFGIIKNIRNELIIDRSLLVISNTLNYHQYHNHQYLLEVASFFIGNLNINIQPCYSKILFILHQIIDIAKESVPIIVNQSTISILLHLISNSSLNIRVAAILIFISFLKKSDDEYREILYNALSWSWFKSIWQNSQSEIRESLSELFYFLIYYNRALLKAAIDQNVVLMILNSIESSSFSLRVIITQNIIRIALLGDIKFIILVINNDFLILINEFISISDADIEPFIIRFYFYIFHLLENKQIKIENINIDNLHDHLLNINISDIELSRKIKFILQNIESIEENL